MFEIFDLNYIKVLLICDSSRFYYSTMRRKQFLKIDSYRMISKESLYLFQKTIYNLNRFVRTFPR